MNQTTRSPEYHLAAGVIGGLRQDLLHDAFAYRPLPRRRVDGPVVRRLPRRIREHAGWAPHAVVLGFTLILLIATFHTAVDVDRRVYAGTALTAAALAMTLLRPAGAFWLSMAAAPVTGLFTVHWHSPWPPSLFTGHLAVMTVVALRTRPRTAAWMWSITFVYGYLAEFVVYQGYGNHSQMVFASAVILLLIAIFQVRKTADEKVAAQETVTAVERDRRTLLEERTTIARELHDVVAHHMSVVAIQAEAAPYRVENPPPELEQAFVTIRENAVAALGELRRILGVVRAEDYEAPDAPQPVLADLDNLLGNVREAGLTADKTVTGAVRPLPQGVELSAYRIIQEALSNALRHAPGSTAKVEIGYVLGGLGLRIVNTAPQGLVKPSPGAGHGITGMRERVTMLNGEMTNEPTEDGGYEVTAFIPVPVAVEEHA